MMSTPDKVVPFKWAPAMRRTIGAPQLTAIPGLRPETIRGLDASYPGTLTDEMRALLHETCGLSVSGFATIDYTGGWYPEEPIGVLRPSLTLAIDDEGRRWIGETSRQQGLPGPIWCVIPEPAVAIYVSDDLSGFLDKLNHSTRQGHLAKWLRGLHGDAHRVWAHRYAFARESYDLCREDQSLRGWLAELPIDARIYDLRAPAAVRGWPYGLAGPDARFYRCGRLPVFAVAAAPSATRWRQHMAEIAATGELRCPAVVASLAA
jgi:hypothetical protein